jgi:hypothetical protein
MDATHGLVLAEQLHQVALHQFIGARCPCRRTAKPFMHRLEHAQVDRWGKVRDELGTRGGPRTQRWGAGQGLAKGMGQLDGGEAIQASRLER